jgi:hypothetical protein
MAKSSQVLAPLGMPLHTPTPKNSESARKTKQKTFAEFLVR